MGRPGARGNPSIKHSGSASSHYTHAFQVGEGAFLPLHHTVSKGNSQQLYREEEPGT